MEERILISPKRQVPVYAEICLPASKSVLNRHLLMAALQGVPVSEEHIENQADDVRLMYSVIKQIDEACETGRMTEIGCQNAATVFRMASVYAAYRGGDYSFTGTEALKRRPVGELAAGLSDAGALVAFRESAGYPPLFIHSGGFNISNLVLKASESSQHVSGFLLAGACIQGGLTLEIKGLMVSEPYINLTLRMMQEAGAMTQRAGNRIRVEETGYPAISIRKEGDWSSAAFFYAALCLMPEGSSLLLKNLRRDSGQADEEAAGLFGLLGIETQTTGNDVLITRQHDPKKGFNADFTNCPDLFNAFATAAALRQTPCTLTGLRHLRFKESDRLTNLLRGLDAMGCPFHQEGDVLQLAEGYHKVSDPPGLNSTNDHRMAMSFALAGLRHPVILHNPYVVSKSFPGFYPEFSKIADIKAI
ncbi:MAG TPA: hypothetical protein P5228_07820 [Bacteroidales bacterium]|nr:hypothetical protein [Bacteroidales bacterium]HRZ48955.1 hypothetical protein [Bacteroidales bacterium]